MRILHAPINIAGQPATIARAQRALGHQSDVLVYKDNDFHYWHTKNLHFERKNFTQRIISYLMNFFQVCNSYDVFHFHYGLSLLPWNLDLPLLKMMKKKVIMQYWGSDVIQTDVARSYTLLSEEVFLSVYPTLNNKKRRKKLDWVKRNVSLVVLGDYSLLPYLPQSKVIRQALDCSTIPYKGVTKSVKPILIHAPTNRAIKGTDIIEKTIHKLQKTHSFVYVRVEKKSNKEAIEIYKSADIIIDDILQGPYGILAIECMALGKPVLCRIDEKLTSYYPDLPIVNTTPTNIYETLIDLLQHPEKRVSLGLQGRKYTEKHHDAKKIAQEFLDLYKV